MAKFAYILLFSMAPMLVSRVYSFGLIRGPRGSLEVGSCTEIHRGYVCIWANKKKKSPILFQPAG